LWGSAEPLKQQDHQIAQFMAIACILLLDNKSFRTSLQIQKQGVSIEKYYV
jgi:hypothetical protein